MKFLCLLAVLICGLGGLWLYDQHVHSGSSTQPVIQVELRSGKLSPRTVQVPYRSPVRLRVLSDSAGVFEVAEYNQRVTLQPRQSAELQFETVDHGRFMLMWYQNADINSLTQASNAVGIGQLIVSPQ